MAAKKLISFILSIILIFTILPAIIFTADAANSYTDQFDYYVNSAERGGLIPSLSGSLDEYLTEGDFLDFIFQFAKVKCGIDADSYLKYARAIAVSDAEAKVIAYNKIINQDILSLTDENDKLTDKISIGNALGLFQAAAHMLLVPFSPLLYYPNNPMPSVDRYNFHNIPSVVYHEEVLLSLMSEIIGLSKGVQRTDYNIDGYITRRQFAAFYYMISTMSLPRDISNKYPGGVSGDKIVDDFIAGILNKAVKSSMTDTQKVKAIYDYIIYNFKHDDNAMPMLIGSSYGNPNPLTDAISLSYPIVMTGKGTCDVHANVFRLLAIRLGFECNYVSGYYVTASGSKSGHGFNQIKVGDEWYWTDVDVESAVFKNGSRAEPSYYLFMKKDGEWITNHQWNRSGWPAADKTKHPVELSRLGKPIPVPGVPKIKNGDPLGNVLYSNITAYVNGSQIPTSTIAGKTLVAVEDLVNYGFDVTWNNKDRSLRVELNKSKKITPLSVEKNTRPTGTVKCKYVYTDIKTYISGEQVKSYAIDGVTLIDFELLAKYGTLNWRPVAREIHLNY